MPSTFVFARNGMGDYTTGAGMREDMLMQVFNMFLWQAGVFASTDFAVTETGTPSMAVTVAAGRCFVLNSSYVANTANSTKYWGVLAEEFELAISANVSGSTRYDIVVVKIDTGAAANDYATNVATVEIVVGTPGAGVPATPSNCLKIAEVEVASGATSITDSEITDSRVFLQMKERESDVDWTDYSSTITYAGSGSMTLTDNNTILARYKRTGKRVDVQVVMTTTTVGSAGNGIIIELPIPAKYGASNEIAGGCTVTDTARQSGFFISTSTTEIACRKSDNSNYGIGTNRSVSVQFFYEID